MWRWLWSKYIGILVAKIVLVNREGMQVILTKWWQSRDIMKVFQCRFRYKDFKELMLCLEV